MSDLTPMAPDAAERDALRRELIDTGDDVIRADDVEFVTKNLSDEEQAAVLAVLLAMREEERDRVRLVARRDREPWTRSQRTPEGIGELLNG
ncbi:hypothetical protein JSO19_09760 [Leucobacter sp. UCMA 4100]|uniref:hypothetical protein n=1 Tax=Leucobacter TaxID=55968 RepID=UPI001C225B38|nr:MULTISPECIES: hypothetical protein [Leucobacter]MDA3147661.1 hypothetical protein [Leucobacter sp. UCMA 4100]